MSDKNRHDLSVLINDCLSLVGLQLFSKPMGTGPFSQAHCFTIALLCAREFVCEIRDPVEYYRRLSEPQEEPEQSSPCVVHEVQGWGILAGVALAVFVGSKYCHLGSSRSVQLAFANEVSESTVPDSQ